MTEGRARRGRAALVVAAVTVLASALAAADPASAVNTPVVIDTSGVGFGEVQVGGTAQQAVILLNAGGSPFGPVNMFGGAPPTPEFTASQNCQGIVLPPGGSCQITYRFTPSSPGPYTATSAFTLSPTGSQADGEDFSVALNGTGCEGAACTVATTTTTTTAPVAETPMAPQGQTPAAPTGQPAATPAGPTPAGSPPGTVPDASTPPTEAGPSPTDTAAPHAVADSGRTPGDDEVAVADLDDGAGSGATWLLVASIALIVLTLGGGAVALAYQRGRSSATPPPHGP